jgi:hypothetical protein
MANAEGAEAIEPEPAEEHEGKDGQHDEDSDPAQRTLEAIERGE